MSEKGVLTVIERAVFLMGLDLFKRIQTEQVALIAAMTSERYFETKEVIFHQDDPADGVYLVLDGEVELERDGRLVHTVPRGGDFGLPGVMRPDVTRALTARTSTRSHLLFLSREDFHDAVTEHPEFALEVIRGLTAQWLDMSRYIEELEKRMDSTQLQMLRGRCRIDRDRPSPELTLDS